VRGMEFARYRHKEAARTSLLAGANCKPPPWTIWLFGDRHFRGGYWYRTLFRRRLSLFTAGTELGQRP